MISFNFKNIKLERHFLEQVDGLKFAIQSDDKKLENYDLLANLYLEKGDFSTAEILVNEIKWDAFREYVCFDPALLKSLEYNPFHWKTGLDSRLAFDTNMGQLEDFFETFSTLSIKAATKKLDRASGLFSNTMGTSLFKRLFRKDVWNTIFEQADLYSSTQNYLNHLYTFFVKNKKTFDGHKADLIKFSHLLMEAIKNKAFPAQDREKVIYLSFLTAILTCLNEATGYQSLDYQMGTENLRLIQDLWETQGEFFEDMLEDLWDSRKKQ